MSSALITAWNAVVRRAAADWLILSAAMITIVLATVLLAAGPIYVEAVTLGSLHRTLADAPVDDSNVEVSFRSRPEGYSQSNQLVTDEVLQTFASTGGTLVRRIVSDSYELPLQTSADFTDVGLFRYYDLIADHVTVVDGAWPASTDEPHQTAVSESVAGQLGLSVGDEFVMVNRRDRSIAASVTIAGIYHIDDPTDPYWYEDELDLNGFQERASFRTFGPFMVDRDTMLSSLAPVGADFDWRVFPDYDNLTVSGIRDVRGRVLSLDTRLNSAGEFQLETYSVATGVPQILHETDRSLLVTRSGVLLLSAQLAVLAGYALLLTAGLLAESRHIETNLLRSRGASTRQIVTMAIMEGALLTIPAALLAPWIAVRVLTFYNGLGPLAAIDLTLEPTVTAGAYLLAFLASVGCVAALAIPARKSAQSFTHTYVARGRQSARSGVQQAGIDVALLVLAAIALWQLRRYGSQITSTVEGRLGIDPLLVLAPAIGLLAGAVLALRTIPLMARAAERVATAGTSAVAALSAWQVARRPTRYARSALLLIMALSIGIFAAAYTTTWTQAQEDQADFQVGSDIRAGPSRLRNSIPELTLQQAHEQLPGVETSMPVVRQVRQLARSTGNGVFIMLDAAPAASVVEIRDDLSNRPFPELMAELLNRRPTVMNVPLPDQPQRIALDVAVRLEPVPDDFEVPAGIDPDQLAFHPSVALVLQDANGLLHEVTVGAVPVDVGPTRLTVDLVHVLPSGPVAAPTYPLSIVDVVFTSLAPQIPRAAEFELAAISVSPDLSSESWQSIDLGVPSGQWEATATRLPGAIAAPSIGLIHPQNAPGIRFEVASGAGRGPLPLPVHFSLRPAGTTLPERFPIVVSEQFLDLTGTTVGEDLALTSLASPRNAVQIVGTVENFPTVDPAAGEAILIDLPTFQMMNYEPGSDIRRPDERWLDVVGADIDRVAGELTDPPYESTRLHSRVEQSDSLKSDPVALGTVGALSLGFVAAAIFAAVGFSVSSVVSARERLGEFGLLRALGLSPRQLAGWLSIDHGVLVMVSLILGTLVGLLLAWLILPLVSITQAATAAIPGVTVVYPWRTILWLELAVVLVLGVIVASLAMLVRRLGLSALLRLGND